MPHIKANNINLYYEFEGKGDPLVIIGGFTSDHNIFQDFIKPLKEKYKVLTFDNRGFGDSEVTAPPYTIDLLAKDTVSLMNALNIDKAYVIGSSMGSAILQTMCYHYPEKIKKAILSGSFLKLPYTSQMQFKTTSELLLNNVKKELVIKTILPWLYSSEFLKNPVIVNRVIDSMKEKKINPKGYQGQSNALELFDSTSWIDKIKTETLILIGREDIDTPLYCSEEVHKKHKNSTLKIIEKAAHMLFLEKSKETIEEIFRFFD